MNHFDSHAGFTITNVKLQVTEISAKQNKLSISGIDEVYFNEEIDFTKDKETKITSLLQAAFDELNIKNSITSNSASFSLPQELFITAKLPVEQSLMHSDLIEEFRSQLSIMHPYLNWNNYVIRFFEVEFAQADTDNTAIVFATHRTYIKIINDLCGKNNLKLKFIDHCHLASNNILTMNQLSKIDNQLSICISHKLFSILISNQGKLIYYEDIPVNNVNEIPRYVSEKIEVVAQKHFNFTDAYLFGDSASNSVAKVLSETTGINFNLINPFTKFDAKSSLMTNKYYTETNHFFSPSMGVTARI